MYLSLCIFVLVTAAIVAWTLFRGRRGIERELPWSEPIDRHRDLDAIAVASRAWPPKTADAVSDRTWRDLSLDALFGRLDRCITSAGQQMLYRRLRHPSLDEHETRDFNRRVHAFADDASLRGDVERALLPLTKTTTLALAPILHGEPAKLPRGAKLAPLATFATIAAASAAFVWPVALVALLGCIVGSIAVRYCLHGSMSAQATALASLVNLVVSAQSLASLGTAALQQELEALREALASIDSYRTAMTWFTIEPLHINELTASLMAYVNVFFLLDVHAFIRSLWLVRRHGPSLKKLLEIVGELDAARSIASFRAGTPTCEPRFTERGSSIMIEGMRHPLVEVAIPNDVRLDASNGWLVMGSNMSGKSTCLRAIALSALLAQTIGCVPADSYAAPPLVIRTLIQVEDDVLAGCSHFLAEAEAGRDMLLDSHDGDRLCIIDELFRGTNTIDRVAAAGAFLRALNRDGAFVVAATHDAELIALLSGAFRPHYFQENVQGSVLSFDYRLREGALAPRNALAVLEMVGFPPRVLDDARALVAKAEPRLRDDPFERERST